LGKSKKIKPVARWPHRGLSEGPMKIDGIAPLVDSAAIARYTGQAHLTKASRNFGALGGR